MWALSLRWLGNENPRIEISFPLTDHRNKSGCPQWQIALPGATRREAGANENPAGAGLSEERLMGFEPTTFCMASRRSSQLSYSRAVAGF